MTIDEFFAGYEESRPLFDAVHSAIESLGPVSVEASKSQVAFRQHRAFAWAWVPRRYLRGEQAPLVLSVALQRRDTSARWKEIVEPAAGQYMHHLEVRAEEEIDAQVLGWLAEARAGAVRDARA